MGASPHERIVPLNGGIWQQAWQNVYDQEGYEDGHSYSGTFGSKHDGATLVAKNDQLDLELLKVAGDLVTFFCNYDAFAWSAEEQAQYAKWDPRTLKPDEAKKVIDILGEDALRRAAKVYDDKWGPAAAIVGKDHVWFGGYCSD